MNKFLWTGVTMLPLLLIGISAQAGDTDQSVIMNNYTGRYIQFEFSTNNTVWPGYNKAYSLPPHESSERLLSCSQGEKVCYGAWVYGNFNHYWGAGNNESEGCTDCCFRCVGDTVRYNLYEQ